MLLGRKEAELKTWQRSLSYLFGGRARKKRGGGKVGNRKRKKEREKGREEKTLNKNFIKFSVWFL